MRIPKITGPVLRRGCRSRDGAWKRSAGVSASQEMSEGLLGEENGMDLEENMELSPEALMEGEFDLFDETPQEGGVELTVTWRHLIRT